MPFEKTLLLRSFHRFHVASSSKVSKPFLDSLAILLRAGSHQSMMLASSAEGTRCCRFARQRRRNQTSLLYEQDRSRCCRVSGSCEQRAHGPLLRRLWRCRRSDVQHLPQIAGPRFFITTYFIDSWELILRAAPVYKSNGGAKLQPHYGRYRSKI